MSKEKQTEYRISMLHKLALEYSEYPDDDGIKDNDISEIFYDEVTSIVLHGELLNMQFNGLPASGKSTAAFAVANEVTIKAYRKEFTLNNIARDQGEFSRFMTKKENNNIVIVIDEWNELEETGENSTIEAAYRNQLSDVQAQRFVHKISCSPKDRGDKNSYIVVEVIGANKAEKKTIGYVYYRVFRAGTEFNQIIGHVEIDVSRVIEKKWYTEYKRRKFHKMELITSHGIFNPRKLQYAPLVKKVVEKLEPLAKCGMLKKDIIKTYVDKEARKEKVPLTIIGSTFLTAEADAILGTISNHRAIQDQILSLRRSKNNDKERNYTDQLNNKLESLIIAEKEMIEAIKEQKDALEELIKIKMEYEKIDEM